MFGCDLNSLPTVKMTGRTKEKKGWDHNGRTLNENLFVFFHEGSCSFNINGSVYKFRKNDVAIVRKGIYYKPYTEAGCEYTFFHFDASLVEPEKGSVTHKPVIDLYPNATLYGIIDPGSRTVNLDEKIEISSNLVEIELLIQKCLKAAYSYNDRSSLMISLYFTEILTLASANLSSVPNEPDHPLIVRKILNYIDANYTKPILLSDLCAYVKVSKQYCMRIFKKSIGLTINEYVLDLRMQHAVYLLSHTYMNVNEVSSYLGFSCVSYFSEVFKKYYGASPSAYNKNAKHHE